MTYLGSSHTPGTFHIFTYLAENIPFNLASYDAHTAFGCCDHSVCSFHFVSRFSIASNLHDMSWVWGEHLFIHMLRWHLLLFFYEN